MSDKSKDLTAAAEVGPAVGASSHSKGENDPTVRLDYTAGPAAAVGTEAEENHRMGFVSATASDGSKWDRWYDSLPSDLRRKLSLHDFKRLGDLFDTAAAIKDK